MGWPAKRCGEPVRLRERQGSVPLMGYGHEVICTNENYLQHLHWIRLLASGKQLEIKTMDRRDLNRNYGKDLDQINLTRFRQIAQPENSFIIALNDFLNQFRFRLRQSHLADFQIPAFIITSSAAALVVVLLGSSSDSDTKTEKTSAVIGLTASILASLNGSHSDRHYRKVARASDYVKVWTSEPFTTLRLGLGEYKKPLID